MNYSSHRFCIAPMMDWSDKHCRFFWRLISKHARLYTEMVVTGAILHGDRERFLGFNTVEHPLALQLGGSNPSELAQCALIAEEWGYDEVNLNCGCPSDRVQKGKIGAILMHEPELVADCVAAMQAACTIPITVKHRIGVDDMDDYDALTRFIATIADAGCQTFIVHARKAWLHGLSPKENREIPPLKYDTVMQLKRDFPLLNIVINGGITNIDQTKTLLEGLDGVMIGREAYSNPYMLAAVDSQLFGAEGTIPTRHEIIQEYAEYCQSEIQNGSRLHHMSRHILGIFNSQPGGRLFRRHLSEYGVKATADHTTLINALKNMRQ